MTKNYTSIIYSKIYSRKYGEICTTINVKGLININETHPKVFFLSCCNIK